MSRNRMWAGTAILAIIAVLVAGGMWYYEAHRSPAAVVRSAPQHEEVLIGMAAQTLFTYKGKSIHPFCVDIVNDDTYQGTGAAYSASLDACSSATSTVSFDRGYLSATYPTDINSESGYVTYEVLAKKGSKFLLSLEMNSGGSGIFTSLAWFEINGNKITHLSSIDGGDRCNGGVDASGGITNGVLSYSVNGTPPDMVKAAASGTVGFHSEGNFLIEPYKELEASAGSCFATFDYEYDLSAEIRTLHTISLGQYGDATAKADETSAWTKQYTYQACFNKLYNSFIDQGKTELTVDELKQFINQFFDQCRVKSRS